MTSPARARRPIRRAASATRGSTLFLVLILAVLMATVMAGLIGHTVQVATMQKRSNVRLESTYAGEYALETAYQQLNALVAQDTGTLPTIAQTTAVTNLSAAPTSVFTAADGYAWRSFLTVPVENGAVVSAHSNFNPSQGSYKFLSVAEFTHTVPRQGATHIQLQREWTYVVTPLFQYAIFYNGDMELFPGANFLVNGRVHTNGRLYVGTSASITFSDYVSEVNGVSNGYGPLDPRAPGSPGSAILYNRGDPIATTREEPPGALNQDTTDSNTNNDGPRELIEMPNSQNSDPNAADRLYTKAGLKVLVNSTGSATTADSGVSVAANTRVFLTRDGTAIPASDPLATYLGTMFANGSMKDYREGATLATTDVDVAKLTAGYNDGGLPQTIPSTSSWPNNGTVPAALKNQPIPAALRGKDLWNGILYVSDITNRSTHRAGVRLINGASLPDGTESASPVAGLTLVSDNAAYIVGDYNTGGVPPSDSGSNLSANNYASGYTVQPAAVVADAVTVVSSSWIGGNYDNVPALTSRAPGNTTINSALISGVVPSDGASYSGGVENYIRLLENWNGKRLTYYGSMINLYKSRQSTAPWQYTGVYYNAPTRNWYFDTNFLDPRKLPPGTPVSRSLKRGQWAQIE